MLYMNGLLDLKPNTPEEPKRMTKNIWKVDVDIESQKISSYANQAFQLILPIPCFSIRPIRSASVNRGGGLVSPSTICK